eukprot:PhM_4_TR1730/c0_g1_i2/m.86887
MRHSILLLFVATVVITMAQLGHCLTDKPPIVIIDTDVDVDDVVAFHYAFRLNTVRIPLVTTTGNSWAFLSNAVENTKNILADLNRNDVDVGAGYAYAWANNQSHGCKFVDAIPIGGPGNWGGNGGRFAISMLYGMAAKLPRSPHPWEPSDLGAVDKIVAAIENSPGSQVRLLSLGGLTTFATLLREHPELKPRIEAIYVMGGAVDHKGNLFSVPTNTVAEFNIYVDPDAADFVFRSGVPIYLVPLDATNRVPYNATSIQWVTSPTVSPPWVAELMNRTFAADGMPPSVFFQTIFPWDEVATVIALNPEVHAATTWEQVPLRVVTDVPNQEGWTKRDAQNGTMVNVATNINPDAFWKEWLRVVHP